MACFSVCECSCGESSHRVFDKIIKAETNFGVTMADVAHSNIGWFMAKSFDQPGLDGWRLEGKSGIYILWWKDDYCAEHEMFHMTALYAGKGVVARRFLAHYSHKDFEEEMLVYWTYFPTENRKAKYIEQLLLDTYNFKHNRAENRGTLKLCANFTQTEVD